MPKNNCYLGRRTGYGNRITIFCDDFTAFLNANNLKVMDE